MPLGSRQDLTTDHAERENPGNTRSNVARRAWTIKGISQDAVDKSRKAAQLKGMFVSLWVEKQLRDAAMKELSGEDTSNLLAAQVLSTKVENIEAMLLQYIREQDKQISKLHDEIHALSSKIVPPLIDALSNPRRRKSA